MSSPAAPSPDAPVFGTLPADADAPTRGEVWLGRVAIGALLAAVLCIGLAAVVGAVATRTPTPAVPTAHPHVAPLNRDAPACLDAARNEQELMACLKRAEADALTPTSD